MDIVTLTERSTLMTPRLRSVTGLAFSQVPSGIVNKERLVCFVRLIVVPSTVFYG